MTELAHAAPGPAVGGAEPTIWGLPPVQVHDRFWAARGVQVVRQGERSEIVERAELFLLAEPGRLALFKLRILVETLSWLKPRLLILRIRDRREQGYRETAIADDEGRIHGFERHYQAEGARRTRVALTTDPKLAKQWQTATSPREGWKALRRAVPQDERTVRSIPGAVYDARVPEELVACVHSLVSRWKRPDATIPLALRTDRDVWGCDTAAISPGAVAHGSVWVGAGRRVAEDDVVMGPAVLWDDPGSRPAMDEVEWQELEPLDILRLPVEARPPGLVRRTAKRLFDIAFSLFALGLTLPLYPIIAIAILIEDGWPIFFAHRRETIGGRIFPCIKFRSMRKDADRIRAQIKDQNRADGPQFFIENDPRITRVGRFLRKSQLDEIPQFLNVLVGHMSVVGPRPSPYEENQFCPQWRDARLSVRPGVTGLWQVQRTREEGKDFQEWIRYDLEYVERQSWALDLKIIWQTVAIVVTGKGKA